MKKITCASFVVLMVLSSLHANAQSLRAGVILGSLVNNVVLNTVNTTIVSAQGSNKLNNQISFSPNVRGLYDGVPVIGQYIYYWSTPGGSNLLMITTPAGGTAVVTNNSGVAQKLYIQVNYYNTHPGFSGPAVMVPDGQSATLTIPFSGRYIGSGFDVGGNCTGSSDIQCPIDIAVAAAKQ